MGSRWPFVGRARELARVQALLAAGVGALIVGEPGVGKSAFAREVGRRAAAHMPVGQIVGHAVSSGTPFEAFAGALAETGGARGPDARQTDQAGPDATDLDTTELDIGDVMRKLFATIAAPPGKPALLAVDDVQLIDDRSAQVLLSIAAASSAIVVATAPEGARLSPAADRLWRDGWCERIELKPMADDDVAAFLSAALGGAVEARTVRIFVERSGGNALFLRELMTATLDQSLLVERNTGAHSVWTLLAQPRISRGIRDVVAERLAGLPEAERAALELIAAGEPLTDAVATDLIGAEVLDQLARERLIAVRDGLAGPAVTTAHPLYGDVLRADLPVLRLHRLRLLLARRIEEAADPLPHDLVRAAVWRLDSGQAGPCDQLVAAARAARPISLATAERLARHAFEASGSLPAALLLAEVLTHSGRADAAAELTARLPPESLQPADREAIVYCAAIGQGLLSGEPGAGADLVAGVLAGVASASEQLRALHAALLAFDARFSAAIEVGSPIVNDPAAAPPARTFAAIGTAGAAYWLGHYRQAVAVADTIYPVAVAARELAPFGLPSIELIAICALTELGELDAAQQRALALRRFANEEHDVFAGPRADYCLGRIALFRGQSVTARELFARSLADHSPFDSFMERHLAAMVARAAAACGDVASGTAALDAAADKIRMKTYDPEDDLAEAATLAAALRMREAAERAAWAAGVAAAQSQWNLAVAGYHDAARYGAARQVVRPMSEAFAHVEGALAQTFRNHVVALAAADATALEQVGRRFEAHGATHLAGEAAAEAALAHAAAHHTRAARASGTHASRLWSDCQAIASPWLIGATVAAPLTSREREIAALAAAGLSDAAIAGRLQISIRTVQTHLGHVYDKVGSAGRSDLAVRLADRIPLSREPD